MRWCKKWCKKIECGPCNLRQTKTRNLIFDFLNKTDKHFTVEEIFWEMKKRLPGIGLATIYRTLDLLVEFGLVKKIELRDGKARYEFIKNKSPHFHLICKKCGKIIDAEFKTDWFKILRNEVFNNFDFSIEDYDIQLMGLCKTCRDPQITD